MRTTTIAILSGAALVASAAAWAQNPADQVVARIGADKITRADVLNELPPGTNNPQLERVTLRAMVNRQLLAAEARRRGLDRTPVGTMVLKRADELALVGVLQRKFAGAAPVVSDAQVAAFVAGHPAMFAQRRLISVNQLLVGNSNSSLFEQLKAADTMSDFEGILLRNRVAFQRSARVFDTMALPPDVAGKLGGFTAGKTFMTPRGDSALELSEVTDNRSAAITGADANQMARLLLARQQVVDRVSTASQAIVKAAQSDVRLNPQFAPKKP